MPYALCDFPINMHLIIDGYNLLHVNRSSASLNSIELQWERDRLIDRLSAYRQQRTCDILVVFDGWQGGWATEKREKKKGIDLIFSKLGEKADEVIKRLVRERGAGSVIITSDREVAQYAERMSVSVVPSDQFRERMESAAFRPGRGKDEDEEEERAGKRKGPSRRLSKKEKRLRTALKKL